MEQTTALSGKPRRRKWAYAISIAIVLAGATFIILMRRGMNSDPPDSRSFEGDSAGLHQTQIVPTLDTPLETAKSAVWCAAFQWSWKKLQKDVAGAPVQLDGADSFCARLNAATDPGPDLPSGSSYAATGWVDKGILQTIDRDFRAAFPAATPPSFPGIARNSYLAYAYLQASVSFTIPYFEETKPVLFTDASGKTTGVRAFGVREQDDYAYKELRQQAKLLYVDEESQPPEFAVDLCRDSQPVQLVVACITRGATLAATLDALEKQIATSPKEMRNGLGINDVLLVPKIEWRIAHHFREIEGKRFANAGLSRQEMDVATQEIRFKLDKSGMDLKAEAKHHMKPVAKHYIVNRPFLVYAMKRGAARPFFVMWVENTELLTGVGGGTSR